jgi:hypothetical protein
MSLVTFALPFDTSCLQCGTAYACGRQVFATKRVAAVSQHSGLVTWRYNIQCACCSADLEYRSYSGQDQYKAAGAALKIERPKKTSSNTDATRHGPSTGLGFSKPRERQLDDTRQSAILSSSRNTLRTADKVGRICEGSAAELHALQRQRDANYADMANTACFLEQAHRNKWSNTPLRLKSRDVVDEARRWRAASLRGRARKISSGAIPSLMKQQSRTGRMERLTFKLARRTVKKLSNSGALEHVKKLLEGVKKC